MIILIIGLSILFASIGYVVTEKNAKNLLSGYNTMSEAESKTFDLKSYIPAFRKFHLFLTMSLLVIGIVITLWVGENVAGIFIVVYPLLAYIGFSRNGKKYFKGQKVLENRSGITFFMILFLLVIILLSLNVRENKLTVTSGSITIDGIYGEKICFIDIDTVILTESLPGFPVRISRVKRSIIPQSINRLN